MISTHFNRIKNIRMWFIFIFFVSAHNHEIKKKNNLFSNIVIENYLPKTCVFQEN